jgi:predicted nucleic acid-binding protein
MPEAPLPQGWALAGEICILDTHVVLELFWFGDPRARPLLAALQAGRLRWHAAPAMRAELSRVLLRLPQRSQAPSRECVLTSFDRTAVIRECPAAAPRLWCTDPADQMFVDLALAAGARWLFTRDHALRNLARRARHLGCAIVPPERYVPA